MIKSTLACVTTINVEHAFNKWLYSYPSMYEFLIKRWRVSSNLCLLTFFFFFSLAYLMQCLRSPTVEECAMFSVHQWLNMFIERENVSFQFVDTHTHWEWRQRIKQSIPTLLLLHQRNFAYRYKFIYHLFTFSWNWLCIRWLKCADVTFMTCKSMKFD